MLNFSAAVLGPLYAETDLSRLPVEPWNTGSNLIFLAIFLHWWRKTAADRTQHRLIRTCLPILFVGFVGGTVWHGLRSSRFWLLLDFLPIFLAVLTAGVFFWALVLRSRAWATVAVIAPFGLLSVLWQVTDLSFTTRISISYSTLAAILILPGVLVSARRNWIGLGSVIGSIAAIGVGIVMRQIDLGIGREIFPMGTHFLWHLFGGVSVHLLIDFIYTSRIELEAIELDL